MQQVQSVIRIGGEGILATIVGGLHIVPASYRPVTTASHTIEHVAVFLALGLVFGLGYHRRMRALIFALPAYCLFIEGTQLWISGRHARASDLLVNVVSALFGLAVAVVVAGRWPASGGPRVS